MAGTRAARPILLTKPAGPVPSADGSEVSDIMTGLVWRRCADGMAWNDNAQTCDGEATRFMWTDALKHVRQTHEGGWRLPNVKELYSIIELEPKLPALTRVKIDHRAFPNTPDWIFFSSTAFENFPDVYVHVVEFGYGTVVHNPALFPGFDAIVRMVRRGRE